LKIACETQSGVRRDRAFTLHDFINATRWNADVMGEAVFGQAKGQDEILAENFTRMNGGVLFHGV
jgi:hypothetical protein